MRCPYCADNNSKVIDSRETSDGGQIRRRRECLACNARFTTYEVVELNLPRIIKRGGVRETFNELKLRSGLQRALEKRPVSADQLEAIVTAIKNGLMAKGEREINAREIGEQVMDELKGVDKIAYIRFASVYRSFQDVSEFRDVIEGLEDSPKGR
ncbi:MAG: transcriptional regulator NrdR [Methylococcales bacterium]|jgi:transcriptional repressor NrdR|nr:transcriptional regulator NrdR [Methylococcales bacterium]MBT7442919.1 transcriptional regulator NrdR [Methylococcales bacterium]